MIESIVLWFCYGCVLIVFFGFAGFLIHKTGVVDSWGAGVKYFFAGIYRIIKAVCTFLYNTFYEEITGQPLPQNVVDKSLYLTNQESLDLVEALSGHPYDSPVLHQWSEEFGIIWIDILAVGLAPAYKDCSRDVLLQICTHVILTFFMRHREMQISLYIKVCTPTRLYFAIPVSQAGRDFLEKQKANQQKECPDQNRNDILEEVIELSPEESEDDYRL